MIEWRSNWNSRDKETQVLVGIYKEYLIYIISKGIAQKPKEANSLPQSKSNGIELILCPCQLQDMSTAYFAGKKLFAGVGYGLVGCLMDSETDSWWVHAYYRTHDEHRWCSADIEFTAS